MEFARSLPSGLVTFLLTLLDEVAGRNRSSWRGWMKSPAATRRVGGLNRERLVPLPAEGRGMSMNEATPYALEGVVGLRVMPA